MEPDARTTDFSEFLDDYFAECDEHLAHVKRLLLEIESPTGGVLEFGDDVLGELLRRFHTIKGLSMMVGFNEAGELAHEVESALRKLSGTQTSLSGEIVGTLADAVKLVEQAIAFHRGGEKPRAIKSIIKKLASLGEAETQVSVDGASDDSAGGVCPASPGSLTSRKGGPEARTLKFEFVPTEESARQGINVGRVREILERQGRLLAVEPTVRPEGQIAFCFTVALEDGQQDLEPLRGLGLTWEESELPTLSPSAPERSPSAPSTLAPSSVIRVDLSRLDDLMRMCGELILTRNRLEDALVSLRSESEQRNWRVVQETVSVLERQMRTLREGVMRVRMVPMGDVFERLRFAIHDLARDQAKSVQVVSSGADTEVDKLVVERILDPLLHLVRNAVTHGLEPPEQRVRMGKPERGTVFLAAKAMGDMLLVSVRDDGAGIDISQIRAKAVALGLVGHDDVLEPERLIDVLSHSGFSTRASADLASGRGVGMSIVKQTVEELGGEVSLWTAPGQGTEFALHMPLTLSILDAVLVRAGGRMYAVPLLMLREVVEVDRDTLAALAGGELMPYRGSVLPLVHLADLFRLERSVGRSCYALVVGTGAQQAGIVVDEVLEQREVVVSALTDPLVKTRGVAGATQLGDGRLVLILDPPRLIRGAENRPVDGAPV